MALKYLRPNVGVSELGLFLNFIERIRVQGLN